MNDSDEFTEKMWHHMQLVNQEMATKITDLRIQNSVLKKTIGNFPGTAWELQEKVTMLEQSCEKWKARALRSPMSVFDESPAR